MEDRSGQGSGEPALGGFPVTPDNAAYLPVMTRAVYIGGTGNLALLTVRNDVLIFVGLVTGTILPICAKKVYSTGTTATNLVGLY